MRLAHLRGRYASMRMMNACHAPRETRDGDRLGTGKMSPPDDELTIATRGSSRSGTADAPDESAAPRWVAFSTDPRRMRNREPTTASDCSISPRVRAPFAKVRGPS